MPHAPSVRCHPGRGVVEGPTNTKINHFYSTLPETVDRFGLFQQPRTERLVMQTCPSIA